MSNSTFLDIMKQHPEVKTWQLDLYSMETPRYTKNGQYTYCNPFYVDEGYHIYTPKHGTPVFLQFDNDYSFYGDADGDLGAYVSMYETGMLDAIECTAECFDTGTNSNGEPLWSLTVMRDDISHYIIDDRDVHPINKIKHSNNGNEYLMLLARGDVAFLVEPDGDTYIVALGVCIDEDERIRWSQGMYFVDEFNAFSDALEYYYKKINE